MSSEVSRSNGRVAGKTALVTGAGRGIGRAIAERFGREGALTFVTDILASDVEETASLIRRAGGTTHALRHDVTDPGSWQSVVSAITLHAREAGRLPSLDILVNNAGRCVLRNLADSSLPEWRETLAINLDSVFLGLHHCLPLLRASDAASVINLSSTSAMNGVPGLTAYSAAKGGIRALSRAAAIELAQQGFHIRVNSLHPGPVDTERAIALMGDAYGMAPDTVRDHAGKALPLGRLGQPGDIANAALFLASDESAWTTGAEFVVDGGELAR